MFIKKLIKNISFIIIVLIYALLTFIVISIFTDVFSGLRMLFGLLVLLTCIYLCIDHIQDMRKKF